MGQNARTQTVTEFTPGETITVQVSEYIPHPGYYRVAFDVDGDDEQAAKPMLNHKPATSVLAMFLPPSSRCQNALKRTMPIIPSSPIAAASNSTAGVSFTVGRKK